MSRAAVERERNRIDISQEASEIIYDLIDRGHFAGTRELIDEALSLLQLKLVNDSQSLAEIYEDKEGLSELADLQLGDGA